MRRISVGLCGMTKSGKDFVAGVMARREFGRFRSYNLTERVLSPISLVRNQPTDRDGLRRLLTKLDNIANEMLFVQVIADGADRIVLPNVRMLSTIDFWKHKSGYEFFLVKIDASEQTRYQRYVEMRRSIDPRVASVEEFRVSVDAKDLNVNELDIILKKGRFAYVIRNNEGDNTDLQVKELVRDVLRL
jgi:hypothetical protein